MTGFTKVCFKNCLTQNSEFLTVWNRIIMCLRNENWTSLLKISPSEINNKLSWNCSQWKFQENIYCWSTMKILNYYNNNNNYYNIEKNMTADMMQFLNRLQYLLRWLLSWEYIWRQYFVTYCYIGHFEFFCHQYENKLQQTQ